MSLIRQCVGAAEPTDIGCTAHRQFIVLCSAYRSNRSALIWMLEPCVVNSKCDMDHDTWMSCRASVARVTTHYFGSTTDSRTMLNRDGEAVGRLAGPACASVKIGGRNEGLKSYKLIVCAHDSYGLTLNVNGRKQICRPTARTFAMIHDITVSRPNIGIRPEHAGVASMAGEDLEIRSDMERPSWDSIAHMGSEHSPIPCVRIGI